jgi:hypothetical protein
MYDVAWSRMTALCYPFFDFDLDDVVVRALS